MQNVSHAKIIKYGFDITSCIVVVHTDKGLAYVEWNDQHIEAD